MWEGRNQVIMNQVITFLANYALISGKIAAITLAHLSALTKDDDYAESWYVL